MLFIINLRTVNWLQCTHVLLFLKYNMVCGQRSPIRDTQPIGFWLLSHMASHLSKFTVLSRKFEVLGTRNLFRSIENSNYGEVDRIYITP